MTDAPRGARLRLALRLLVPPALLVAALVAPDAIEVARTGICPGAPPDVAPYPCGVGQFLGRALFGPFALPALAMIFALWALGVFAARAITRALRRR